MSLIYRMLKTDFPQNPCIAKAKQNVIFVFVYMQIVFQVFLAIRDGVRSFCALSFDT